VAGLTLLACIALVARGEATARASWQEPTALLPTGESSGSADASVDAGGTLFVVWEQTASARTGESFLMAQERPAGGAWQPPVRISGPGVDPGEVKLVSDARGDEAVTWEQSPVSANKWTVVAARRPAGGAWSAPARLSPPGVEGRSPIAAIGASGSVVVAWSRASHSDPASEATEAVVASVGGGWQAPEQLGVPGRASGPLGAAVDALGDATILLSSSRPGTGHAQTVEVATRAVDADWQVPVRISPTLVEAERPRLAVGPWGEMTVSWEAHDIGRRAVQIEAASFTVAGGWQPPVTLATIGDLDRRYGPGNDRAPDPAVTIGSQGDVSVIWRRFPDATHVSIEAATRTPGGAWQSPSRPARSAFAIPDPYDYQGPNQQIAIDALGDQAASWSRWDGSTEVVEAATRTADGAWQPPVTLSALGSQAEQSYELTQSSILVLPEGGFFVSWSSDGAVNPLFPPATETSEAALDILSPGAPNLPPPAPPPSIALGPVVTGPILPIPWTTLRDLRASHSIPVSCTLTAPGVCTMYVTLRIPSRSGHSHNAKLAPVSVLVTGRTQTKRVDVPIPKRLRRALDEAHSLRLTLSATDSAHRRAQRSVTVHLNPPPEAP
jgi:hypothetical protein